MRTLTTYHCYTCQHPLDNPFVCDNPDCPTFNQPAIYQLQVDPGEIEPGDILLFRVPTDYQMEVVKIKFEDGKRTAVFRHCETGARRVISSFGQPGDYYKTVVGGPKLAAARANITLVERRLYVGNVWLGGKLGSE